MNILVIDDEKLVLDMLCEAIAGAVPQAEIHAFKKPSKLLAFAKEMLCEIAFLDIEMGGMSGLEAAKRLKDIYPKTNIVFVTGYSEYLQQAFSLHASGYVLKPVTKDAILREIENLRHPVNVKTDTGVYVQTFGNFEVFLNGKLLIFPRSKAKELFAFLIDRKGATVTNSEIAAVLWEDKEYDVSLQSQIRNMISYMIKTFREAGAEKVIIKGRNSIAVDKSKIKCDYYDFNNYNTKVINTYSGEYMANYTWAEMTAGMLNEKTTLL